MERFRDALRQLEIQAEKFDRLIGCGAIKQPGSSTIDDLVQDVQDLRETLHHLANPIGTRRTAAMAPAKPADVKQDASGKKAAAMGPAKPADEE